MDTQHLHAILQEIWNNLNCKQCWSKVDIWNVTLIMQKENYANFEINCNKCNTWMQIQAEITKDNNIIWSNIEKKDDLASWNAIDTIITKNEINKIWEMLQNLSSFKDIFWIFLIVVMISFWWCTKQNDIKDNIKNKINEAWQTSVNIYEEWKENFSWAINTINQIPEEINNTIEDVKTLKKETEETLQKTQEAIDKMNEASKATKDAVEAIQEINR